MDAASLRATQAPLKARYKSDPSSALVTLKSTGDLSSPGLTCSISTAGAAKKIAGLHPLSGGDPLSGELCSGDLLLEALVSCAGVTLRAVATAIEVPVVGGEVRAEGDLDFRGTMGVDREASVGFREIRMSFEVRLEGEVEQAKLDTLLKLTERYCVVLQTIKNGPELRCTITEKE